LNISENGLKANQEWINSISHNVANMQTAGFKKTNVSFNELVNSTSSADNPQQLAHEGMGVTINNQSVDFSKGDIKSTSRALDIAINGNGFLELEKEDGETAYTKLGRLNVNADGRLVAHDGSLLSSEIIVPAGSKSIHIGANGLVSAEMTSGEFMDLGNINIAQFSNPEYLKPIGNEIYVTTQQSGEPEINSTATGNNTIMQGFLEMSNVNMIDEMSDLLMAQRAYQLNARLIQTADQILETINNLRR